jgi:hypothetical protein
VNGNYPDKIIIYRDGVGDGQLKLVTDIEIPQIKAAFESIGPTYKYSHEKSKRISILNNNLNLFFF